MGESLFKTLHCPKCQLIIIKKQYLLETELDYDLPSIKKIQPEEAVRKFCKVNNQMDFENIGVSHSMQGKKFLCCADCELGPFGFIDDSGIFLEVERLSQQ